MTSSRSLLLFIVALLACCIFPLGTAAQEALSEAQTEGPEASAEDETADESAWQKVEEVVVVGTAQASLAQEETTSTISFDAAILEAERIQNIGDLSNFTPNLEIKTAFAATNPTLFIRGIGLDDFNANSASAVAVYQDGVYMNSPAGQLFQFFDVRSVNVLRGPHSGRYRNASAGAILVESQQPTNQAEGYAVLTYGSYNLVETEGVVNIPLAEDVLSSRFSGKFIRRDGWTRNRCGGQPLVRFNNPRNTNSSCYEVAYPDFSLGEDQDLVDWSNDAFNWAARGQLLWTVPLRESSMEWLFNLHGGQNDSLASQFQQRAFEPTSATPGAPKYTGPNTTDSTGYHDLDGDPFAGDYNHSGKEKLDLYGGNLRGIWQVSEVHEVVSLTAYEYHRRRTLDNTDANPRNLFTSLYRDEAWQLSQDLRLDSKWSDTLETNLGGYYIMEDLTVDNEWEQSTVFILSQKYEQNMRSAAVYGDVMWEFLPDFTFDGSFRYTFEYKSFDLASRVSNAAGVSGIPLKVGTANGTFTGPSGMLGLSWRFADEQSVYAKYTRGWKPGHFNGGSVFSGQLIEPVLPEELNAVEIGFKGSLFENRASYELAAFYYDFRNLQIFALEQDAGSFPLPQLINAQGATIYGVEAQFILNPVEGLEITLNGAFLDTTYSEFTNTLWRVPPSAPGTPRGDPVPVVMNYTGNEMIGSPKWSFSGSVEYVIPLSSGISYLGELAPRFSFAWKDFSFFDASEGRGTLVDLPYGTIAQPAYFVLNAGLSWRFPDQNFELTGWVRNLTNQAYRLQSFDVTEGFHFVLDAYAAPRTFGITLTAFY